MKTLLALAAMSATSPEVAPADSPPPAVCASAESRQFDFWLGEWTIEQKILGAEGKWLAFPATTSVSASPDYCVLTEHWSGKVQFFWEGMKAPAQIWGYSVRAFDPADRNWRIYWMDELTPRFAEPYVGGFSGDGEGAFFRDFVGPDGPRRARISFSRMKPDAVDWALAISADGGATWRDLWKMKMTRQDSERTAPN